MRGIDKEKSEQHHECVRAVGNIDISPNLFLLTSILKLEENKLVHTPFTTPTTSYLLLLLQEQRSSLFPKEPKRPEEDDGKARNEG